MSRNTTNKSKIIYDRLYKEYGGEWETMEEFADIFDLTRGGLDYRRGKETVDYDEIKQKLPEVNRDWLYSENINELKSKPVKKNYEHDKYEKGFKSIEDRTNEEDMPYNALDLLIEALVEDANKLQDDLQKIVSRVRKLKNIDRDAD
ncbi:hypothetical protein [Fodinibius sp. SL11]|uniref:hypothetical protein n=1 Tax=Fodinibius sp. SL11 TaxID=3425690 RepID=UPI003F88341E